MPSRRVFLGLTGLTGYGAWVLTKPAPNARKPPKPTTTVAPTTTTAGAGSSKWPAMWPATW